MNLRCASSTVSSVVCQQQTPQNAVKTITKTAATAGFAIIGPYLFSRKLPTLPPGWSAGVQHIWFGSFPPFAMVWMAWSRGVIGQQGQPVGRQKQQSGLLLTTRRVSKVARAVKNVSWKTKSRSTQKAAYMQKEESAGSAEDTEMANAAKSVSEVTIMETPAWEMAFAMRSGTGSLASTWSSAFMMTKESSTPMPRMTKGSTECTGV
mmetsp:Transcript_74591/g.231480  ORF Transcript_74591/g.231480 Transcript_74591/m.231480 type:complete len:207 (+) Transcript_74591:1171-1791(+)